MVNKQAEWFTSKLKSLQDSWTNSCASQQCKVVKTGPIDSG